MKPFGKIVLLILVPVYAAVSIITLSGCAKSEDTATVDYLNSVKKESANLLLQKFDADIFDIHSKELLSRPVILDSTLIGLAEKEGEFFLRAEVKFNGGNKCFAELKCSRQIADSYLHTKSNSVLIAAKLSRIDNCQMFAEADSLNGSTSQLNIGQSILLSGECLALIEIPTVLNVN